MNNLYYSTPLEQFVFYGFTLICKNINLSTNKCNTSKTHFTWNDYDCVYYADDTDEVYFDEVPQNFVVTNENMIYSRTVVVD